MQHPSSNDILPHIIARSRTEIITFYLSQSCIGLVEGTLNVWGSKFNRASIDFIIRKSILSCIIVELFYDSHISAGK